MHLGFRKNMKKILVPVNDIHKYIMYHICQDDKSLKTAVEIWWEEQSEEFYFAGIASLQQKWRKCVKLEADYIEK